VLVVVFLDFSTLSFFSLCLLRSSRGGEWGGLNSRRSKFVR
jgi:hypothetical protein